MAKFPIDLGRSMEETFPMPEKMDRKEKHYPCLYMSWDDKYDLPDSGEMVVKFRKKMESNQVRDGEKSQNVELEIHSIESVSEDKEEMSRDEEFDKRAKRGKYDEDED